LTDGGAARPIVKKRGTVCPDLDCEIFARRVNFAIECGLRSDPPAARQAAVCVEERDGHDEPA
jgi:hypothetical protein